jgi:hypothetical protein
MTRPVTDLRAYRQRLVDKRAGFRGCGWKPLREAVTDVSRAVNCLVPLHLAREEDIAAVAAQLEHCRQLALAMMQRGRGHGQ